MLPGLSSSQQREARTPELEAAENEFIGVTQYEESQLPIARHPLPSLAPNFLNPLPFYHTPCPAAWELMAKLEGQEMPRRLCFVLWDTWLTGEVSPAQRLASHPQGLGAAVSDGGLFLLPSFESFFLAGSSVSKKEKRLFSG